MPPENSDELNALQRMQRRLYTAAPSQPPRAVDGLTRVPDMTGAASTGPGLSSAPVSSDVGWGTPETAPQQKKRRASGPMIFLGVAIGFFVLAVAVAAYFLIVGTRSVSTDHIGLRIEGPAAIGSGDTVTLLVSVDNRNPVPITATLLALELPATSRNPEDGTQSFTRYEDTLGDIQPGASANRSVRAVLFGAEGEALRVPVRFEYRVEGSNAVFVKDAVYEVEVTSSPLSIRAHALSEVAIGQSATFAVTVRSHAPGVLENVTVLLERPLPSGFSLNRGEGPLYAIGTLAPGEERTIQVRGAFANSDAGEKVFRFSAGVGQSPDSLSITTPFASNQIVLSLTDAFLRPSLVFGQADRQLSFIQAGVQNQAVVSWVNSLTVPILDGEVSVALSGSGLDTSSITAYNGFFRSRDTTVVFAKDMNSGLARLDPAATGSGTFSFSAKPTAALIGLRNPTITATLSVAGRRVGESNVPERVEHVITRTIPVGTELNLEARGLHRSGPITNRGPIPPAADQETTYTIELSLANSVNSVADATVSGTLPQYVSFAGVTDPADGSVRYDAATRTITWRAGEVGPGVGHQTDRRTASFQVILLPSTSQRGTSPILFSSIQVTGVDRFTQERLEIEAPPITTRIDADPAYASGDDLVR